MFNPAPVSFGWRDRLIRLAQPPAPFIHNPREPKDFPLGRWNLYIGGAGCATEGYLNLDLAYTPGVDVVADAEHLPFRSGIFHRVECDAVLEHVRNPSLVMGGVHRVLAPGGYAHLVVPFCHPFHAHPKDYRRFTLDGLKELAAPLEIVAEGWRTGTTATLLVVLIEYAKMLFPFRVWRGTAHVIFGWLLFPLRYLDLWLFRSPAAQRIGNHCYVWLRKGQEPRLASFNR